VSKAISKFRHHYVFQFRCIALFCVLALFTVFGSQAQESAVETPAETPLETLPELRHLAATLSNPAARTDALMTMAVTAHLVRIAPVSDITEAATLQTRFRDERAWLDRLAIRFSNVPLRSTVLDISSWFILQELGQHQLSPSLLVSPIGPETHDLMQQVFDRTDERLAAAFLPELLMRMEFNAPVLWQGLLSAANEDEAFLSLLSSLNAEWFNLWKVAEPPAPAAEEGVEDSVLQAAENFQALAASTMREDAPDALRLKQLRFMLLLALPDLQPIQARDAAYLLRLVTAVDGLHDRKYLAFTETLLWVVTDLLLAHQPPVEEGAPYPAGNEMGEDVFDAEIPGGGQPDPGTDGDQAPVAEPDTETAPGALPASVVPRIMSELLPQLSSTFARDFSNVDSRINANLAAAFDIFQSLQEAPIERSRYTFLVRELADAVAQFVLLIPDMNFYFDQPVRSRIIEEINICTSIVAATGRDSESTLSREQFDRCLASLVDLAESTVRSAELAGDPDGPFGTVQLQRELVLTPWQRINYALGYLHEKSPRACESPEEPLPNPLEWSTLATALAWFARQSPVYFQTPENEALVVRMQQQGMELLRAMEQQVACFSGAAGGINDPVSMVLLDYRQALIELTAGIREAELAFRESRLAPGADIILRGDSDQKTAYRPEGLIIGPCRSSHVCEMTGELETTRALIGLFPDHYLIADQTGLGNIEICYDNMQWVERRAEPVRADDPHVANYFGRLSFDLIGRYVEQENTSNVFGSNFISPDEYHYMFAAASDDVLEDSCPTEWIGSKIVTGLSNESGFRVVPDRLTYLASARSQPSQIINLNWNRGAEWRDWFVTGLGITKFEFETDETIQDRINQHLQALYQAEQATLYQALLRRPTRGGTDDAISLIEEMNAVNTTKALVRTQMNLFYPDFLLDSDEIRGSLEGTSGLIDGPILRRFRDTDVAIESINEAGTSRVVVFRSRWRSQSETVRRSGSAAISVAHAIARLNTIYREFFEPVRNENKQDIITGFRG
jgi:hypothetical protein